MTHESTSAAGPDFPRLEEEMLDRWKNEDVFARSLAARQGGPEWVFYEGPPTANGQPGTHHVLARAFKDLYPRYKTMQGYHVARKGGWDCHGLPVELGVEKKLGLDNKDQVEEYGVAAFNKQCRDSVFTYLDDWNKLTERTGYWVDLETPYRTLDNDYVESVWWALKTVWDKDLLYEGHRVVPYCPRCETTLSSHEVAQGYKDVTDTSAYVTMPVTGDHGPLQAGDQLLAWTTTPWTLPANAALAVAPSLRYVRVQYGDTVYVVAASLAQTVFGDDGVALEHFTGEQLAGVRYMPPFSFVEPTVLGGEHVHTVVPASFVTDESGTGVVHVAVAFGDDDYGLGQQYGLHVYNCVRSNGTFDETVTDYTGMFVRDADSLLVEDLETTGRLFRAQAYTHSYPHCWRCQTALLYYAKPSWYAATSKLRPTMLANNETVNWYPPNVKHGRFGNWLENNVDWALSRERYWGTPLPLWRCANDHVQCVGSFAELEELSGVLLQDPHRPYVDDVHFACSTCQRTMTRVPEVLDVWFDSGCMPFAQHHYPFENADTFAQQSSADYVCEALDQTRGWFYSLLAVSTLLGEEAPYKNVACLGLLLDEHGQKMAKSRGNVVDPWEVFDEFGADALRWYFFSKNPWEGYKFSKAAVGEGVRNFMLKLWNTYTFMDMYTVERTTEPTDMDRWALSQLAATVETVTTQLEQFDATGATRTLQAFVDDLSNWYVRRSRRHFWNGDSAAFDTLRTCLTTVSQLLAPFMPFLADRLYRELNDDGSVHLTDWPVAAGRDTALEAAMATARDVVTLGHSARAVANLKVRQPLNAVVVVATEADQQALETLRDLVLDELNVKQLRFTANANELGSYSVKANYRTLGPRFGKQMPAVAAAVVELDGDDVYTALQETGNVEVSVGGEQYRFNGDDLLLRMDSATGYHLQREGDHALALDVTLTDDLVQEGLAREVVRAVQEARKNTGLQVEDRVHLQLGGASELLAAAQVWEDYVQAETLSLTVAYDHPSEGEPTAKVNKQPLYATVTRV